MHYFKKYIVLLFVTVCLDGGTTGYVVCLAGAMLVASIIGIVFAGSLCKLGNCLGCQLLLQQWPHITRQPFFALERSPSGFQLSTMHPSCLGWWWSCFKRKDETNVDHTFRCLN